MDSLVRMVAKNSNLTVEVQNKFGFKNYILYPKDDPEFIVKLSKKLESKDKEVRKLAFKECFKIHDTSVVSAIEKLLLSFDEEEGFCLKLLQNEYILLFVETEESCWQFIEFLS